MKFLHLIWSNLKRKKLRTVLTLLSVLVAFILFGFLSSIKQALTGGVKMAGADRLVVRHKVSIIQLLPESYKARMERIPGVVLATHQTWFGGIYQDPKNFFMQSPVVPEEFFSLHPEMLLPPEQMKAWLQTRTGAVVGRKTADRFHWKIGDKVPIQSSIWSQSSGSRAWEFDVVGIYDGKEKTTDTTPLFFRYDYFEEARNGGKGLVGWYTIRIKDPAQAAATAKLVDKEFENSDAETKTEPEGAFVQAWVSQIGNIELIVVAILGAVFFTILLVTGNTMSQAVRERTGELGVLKAIGFTNAQVVALILIESCLLSVLGGGLGLGLGVDGRFPRGSHRRSASFVLISGARLARGRGFESHARVGHRNFSGPPGSAPARGRRLAPDVTRRPMNWLSQIASITRFGLMSIPQRRGAVAATVIGCAGVVAVLVGVLSMAAGFLQAMTASSSPDAVIVLRSGADSEMVSGFSREQTQIIADSPSVARTAQGPLSSAELFVIINLPKRSTGTDANVPLRGVEAAAMPVRDHIKMIQGRMFDWGKDEVIVGAGAAQEFAGLNLGSGIKVGRYEWPVVGIFSANGAVSESEIWTDAKVLQAAYKRGDSFQSVRARLTSPGAFQEFRDSLTSNPQLTVEVSRQSDYYAHQSEAMTRLITSLGFSVAFLMAIGAVFGALNTMYSAVAARTREIATLRALGFGSGAVVVSLMIESLLLALLGGLAGAALAYFAFNNFHTSTMNFQSFSQVTFAFRVTPQLLIQGMVWATAIGLIGGLLPAVRAARLPIAAALREL